MKITGIITHCLSSPLDHPFAFSQGWVHRRNCTLVEIRTDQGLTGWGEAFLQGMEPPQIAAATIKHALTPLILNADARAIEMLWFRMYNATRDYGRKGSVMSAISAVDMALWDLAGKYYGQPVYRLLGGPFRTEVQPYATGFYRLTGQGEAGRLADEARRHLDNGFSLMKIKLGFGLADDIAVMTAIGEALAGHDVGLMIDTNHAYGRAEALRLGHALEPLNLRWYEEPVVPEDLAGYAELRRALSMPIAGGENEYSLYGFAPLIESGCIDIAQPDIGSCGGITAARHITALAQAHGVMVNPHVWGSAVAQAASLQVLAALPIAHHSLMPLAPVLEYDQSEHPFRRDLVDHPVTMVDGRVAIADRPGLGIEIDPATLARFRLPE